MTDSGQKAQEKVEKAARAQESVKTYLNQLSSVFLAGDMEKNERLRTATRASTLALLEDPNLRGRHKGQVMKYLTELKLVQVKPGSEPTISVADSNFSLTYLPDTDLSFISLKKAKLWNSDFRNSNFSNADLSEANLGGANLSGTDLRAANLRGANLGGANLSDAKIKNAILNNTILSRADLSGTDISDAKFCQTKLPSQIQIDPNRDCKALGITP